MKATKVLSTGDKTEEAESLSAQEISVDALITTAKFRIILPSFTDTKQAQEALRAFEDQAMEMSYENRTIIFKMTPDEIAQLSGMGLTVTPQPEYDVLNRRSHAKPLEDGLIPNFPCYRIVERTFFIADSLCFALPNSTAEYNWHPDGIRPRFPEGWRKECT